MAVLPLQGSLSHLSRCSYSGTNLGHKARDLRADHRFFRRSDSAGYRWIFMELLAVSALLLQLIQYPLTSSARANSKGGTARPSAFAVVRLMTNSYGRHENVRNRVA